MAVRALHRTLKFLHTKFIKLCIYGVRAVFGHENLAYIWCSNPTQNRSVGLSYGSVQDPRFLHFGLTKPYPYGCGADIGRGDLAHTWHSNAFHSYPVELRSGLCVGHFSPSNHAFMKLEMLGKKTLLTYGVAMHPKDVRKDMFYTKLKKKKKQFMELKLMLGQKTWLTFCSATFKRCSLGLMSGLSVEHSSSSTPNYVFMELERMLEREDLSCIWCSNSSQRLSVGLMSGLCRSHHPKGGSSVWLPHFSYCSSHM